MIGAKEVFWILSSRTAILQVHHQQGDGLLEEYHGAGQQVLCKKAFLSSRGLVSFKCSSGY